MATFDLFSAVKDGNTDSVRNLLSSKACRSRLNDRNEWGDTVLHLAAEAGNAEVCQMLIAGGASVTVRNNRGETCLHRAAVGGHTECVKAIVDRDNDPEAVNSQNDAGYTALHHAAKHGSIDLIQVLLRASADRMLENNAGETPYMVAHKYQQYDAERLLLNIEQAHADKAIQEMNAKAKKVIAAYGKAIKHAHKPDSRIRLMFIGDSSAGKTSLKKTLFGEAFFREEESTRGIDADPSITRIQFRQYREWVLQPYSKADAHRLNLEYTDAIIEYVLNEIRKPGPSDEVVDTKKLNLRKQDGKSVNFNTELQIIPDPVYKDTAEGGETAEEEGPQAATANPIPVRPPTLEARREPAEENPAMSLATTTEDNEDEDVDPTTTGPLATLKLFSPPPAAKAFPGLHPPQLTGVTHSISPERSSGAERPSRSTSASPRFSGINPPPSSSNGEGRSSIANDENSAGHVNGDLEEEDEQEEGITVPGRGRQGSVAVRSGDDTESRPRPIHVEHPEKPKRLFFESTQEISKVLTDHVPVEVLKRMVIRWPVEDAPPIDRNPLSRRRLLISAWDCAGDPLQQNIIPLFFSTRSIYLMVYNLTKDLDAPSESYQRHKLVNLEGEVPTNADVLEDWLGNVTTHTIHYPIGPFLYSKSTPQLPPVIFVGTNKDSPDIKPMNQFFQRPSFQTYKTHVLEHEPGVIGVSSHYEWELEEGYVDHHFLRREIEHVARQMPYIYEMVPVHWVKLEQLIHTLLEQKKILIHIADLERYIAAHCDIVGPLQASPAVAHFHDIGTIINFYRHPALSQLVVTQPQWLMDSLSSIFVATGNKWVATEIQNAFQILTVEGKIKLDVLLLAYRCCRLPQRHWNEAIFFFTFMDLVAMHSAQDNEGSSRSRPVYIPSMVLRPPPAFSFGPTESDPQTLLFSCPRGIFPVSLFNQLITRCVRSSSYPPVLYNRITHLRLNRNHHLILRYDHTAVSILVQPRTDAICSYCAKDEENHPVMTEYEQLNKLTDPECESVMSEYMTYFDAKISRKKLPKTALVFTDKLSSLHEICPMVLAFLWEHLEFLLRCWYPGLEVKLRTVQGTTLDQRWKLTVLKRGESPDNLTVWFKK